ncbi:hypothetical protein TNCV_1100571 [Trichonephila clavipes]|nr:hypothetical protein TNCV_1100571 [Trichonephila clavipes]
MEGIPFKKTKKWKRVGELRENPSQTKTVKLRAEGGERGCSGNSVRRCNNLKCLDPGGVKNGPVSSNALMQATVA